MTKQELEAKLVEVIHLQQDYEAEIQRLEEKAMAIEDILLYFEEE